MATLPPIRFDNATDFGIYPSTGKRSEIYKLYCVEDDPDWQELTPTEAEAMIEGSKQ